MATCIAWLLNLDADRELRDPSGYDPNELGFERSQELSRRMADLIAPDDILLESAAPSAVADTATVQAFCPTPSALRRIAELGLHAQPAPAFAVLRAVNDRGFCAELGHGLEGSCFARDMQTLERQLQRPSPTGRYVIKRAFTFAGREQRRVQNGVIDASTRGFCARSLAWGEGLQVEPWVERSADFSKHGYLTRGGALLIGPTREQRCDGLGRFLGMSTSDARIAPDEEARLRAGIEQTASALTAAGYFGPFGIDGFRYRLAGGGEAFNPRCEINARFTMGYPRALLEDGLAEERR
jgi:hypothetical protein